MRDDLRTLRVRVRVKQGDLAELVGVTKAAISAWETGKCQPTMAHVELLAFHLNVSPSRIVRACREAIMARARSMRSVEGAVAG